MRWRDFAPIEPWYFTQFVGYRSIEWCEFGVRGGTFYVAPGLIEELLTFAGAKWQTAINSDVERLNSQIPKRIR